MRLILLLIFVCLSFSCKKDPTESPPTLEGPWKSIYPVDSGSGFWFLESGVMCRYADKQKPGTFNCGYYYTQSMDTVLVTEVCGDTVLWFTADFIRPDYIIATHIQYDSLNFHMKRDRE